MSIQPKTGISEGPATPELPNKQLKIFPSTHKLVKTYGAQQGLSIYDALDKLVKKALKEKE